jgi:SAM-dependent methyltransferase
MKNIEQRWSAEHGRQFDDHYKTMRGDVRREVTRANLNNELGSFLKFPRRVADMQGGRGSDARWLAERHHEVVLADTDEAALAEASQRTYPLLEDILHGDAQTVLDRYGPGSFDLVLSHGALLYLDSPEHELSRLGALLSEGGYLSLLTAGKFGKINRFERNGQSAALTKLLATGKYTNNLGLEAHAYLPQEIEGMLSAAGLNTIAWFGVRIHSDRDTRQFEEVPAFHRNRILGWELNSSRDPSQRPAGQMLHFIARKNT